MSERDELKARAGELGLEFPPRISTEKLKELIAEAEAEAEAGSHQNSGASQTLGDGKAQKSTFDELVDAVVLEPLTHDGEDFDIGTPVRLTKKQFERLESLNVVRAETPD